MLVILQVYSNFFNIYTKKKKNKEVPESISDQCSLSLLLYSGIKTEHWPENEIRIKKIRKIIPQKCKYEVVFKILKNLKSNLTPKKVILCSPTLSLL